MAELQDWVLRTTPIDGRFNDVVYGNGMFIAVAYTGANRIMKSLDGITWTTVSGTGLAFTDIAFGNGIFVAIAYGQQCMTSTDGENWTIRTLASNRQWNCITYSTTHNWFIMLTYGASAADNRVLTSTDGITWIERTGPAQDGFQDVIFANGVYVAVASSAWNQNIVTSTTGTSWTRRTTPSVGLFGITYGNGLFVAVGGTSADTGNIVTSPDGITWTQRTMPVALELSDIEFGNGVFVAISNNDPSKRSLKSTDGITWTVETTPINNEWRGIAYGNNTFVAVAYNGTTTCAMSISFLLLINKYLIKSNANNSYYKLLTGSMQLVSPTPPSLTEQVFLDHGFEDLPSITGTLLNQIPGNSLQIYNFSTVTTPKNITINYTPIEQVIVANGDIDLSNIAALTDLTITGTVTGSSVLKIVISTDSGLTWKTWNGSSWVSVPLIASNIETSGMTISVLNARTSADMISLLGQSNKLRFAYYMRLVNITDTLNTDELTMTVQMEGTWEKAKQNVDYKYSYPNSTKLKVQLLSNGDYKINY